MIYKLDNLEKIKANFSIKESIDISKYSIIFILEGKLIDGKPFASISVIHRLIGYGTGYVSTNGITTSLGGIYKLEKNSILTRISSTNYISNCDIYAL